MLPSVIAGLLVPEPEGYPAGQGSRGRDDPHGLPTEEGGDVLDGVAVEDRVGVPGDVAEVRGEHGARRAAQGRVRGQRLAVVDVEAGAGDAPLVQRVEQGGLVDDRPA